jgi:hypothetical protein
MRVFASRAILGKPHGDVLTALGVTTSAMSVFGFIITHCHTIVSTTGQAHSSNLLGSVRRVWLSI